MTCCASSSSVPQSSAIGIHDGVEAQVTVPEMPGRIFKGRVARSAVALQSSSRSMRTEVDVPNPDHVLRPGLFVDVTFSIPRQTPAVVVPDAALVFNAGGLQVATVGADNAIHFQKVTIYRDFGTTAELRDGLAGARKPGPEPADGTRRGQQGAGGQSAAAARGREADRQSLTNCQPAAVRLLYAAARQNQSNSYADVTNLLGARSRCASQEAPSGPAQPRRLAPRGFFNASNFRACAGPSAAYR